MATKKTETSTVKVKMIQTVDAAPGKDTTVYFTDGSRAVVKRGTKVSDLLTDPDIVAPNIIKVTMRGETISSIKRVEVDRPEGD